MVAKSTHLITLAVIFSQQHTVNACIKGLWLGGYNKCTNTPSLLLCCYKMNKEAPGSESASISLPTKSGSEQKGKPSAGELLQKTVILINPCCKVPFKTLFVVPWPTGLHVCLLLIEECTRIVLMHEDCPNSLPSISTCLATRLTCRNNIKLNLHRFTNKVAIAITSGGGRHQEIHVHV